MEAWRLRLHIDRKHLMMRSGFTLVEMIVVSALVLLISLVGLYTVDLVSQREKEERLRYALLEMRAAMDIYHQERTVYPVRFNDLLTQKRFGGNYGYYLRRLPINPFFGAVKWEIASQTKRIYPSPADEELHWKPMNSPAATIEAAAPFSPIIDVRSPDPGYLSIRNDPYTQW